VTVRAAWMSYCRTESDPRLLTRREPVWFALVGARRRPMVRSHWLDVEGPPSAVGVSSR
jgi:hypothetical protein